MVWRAAVVLLGVFALTACDSPPADPDTLVAKARRYSEKSDHQAAIIELKNALRIAPERPEARLALGMNDLAIGENEQAEKEFRAALTLGADASEVIPLLGRSLFMQGKFRQALEETLPDAKTPLRPSAELWSVRGHAELSLGRLEQAEDLFQQALDLQPAFGDALLGQARMAMMHSDGPAALGLVERALAVAPDKAEAWVMKGDLQRSGANKELALAAYKKAAQLQPGDNSSRLNAALLEIGLGKFENAAESIALVKARSPQSAMANYLEAYLEFQKGNPAASLAAAEKALKAEANHMPSVLLAGASAYALGRHPEAQAYLIRVVERLPGSVVARKFLAQSLIASRQSRRALEVLEPVLKQGSVDESVLLVLAEAYMNNNEFAKAIQYFEQAVSLQPNRPEARTSLGLTRLAAGDSERAIADFEAASRINAKAIRPGVLLVMTHIARREFDKAMQALDEVERKQPRSPLTNNLRGVIALGMKQPAVARRNFEQALSIQPTFFPATMNLVQLDLREKGAPVARKRLEKLLEMDANNSEALMAMGEFAARYGDKPDEVALWLERARKADPGAVRVSVSLARHLLQSGDPGRALVVAKAALAAAPEDGESLDLIGTALIALGESNQAVNVYTKLAALQPKSSLAHFRLATAYLGEGNNARAVIALGKALELNPDNVDAYITLGSLHLSAGRNAEALALARRSQKQVPDSAAGYALEGDVLAKERKLAQASLLYEKALKLSPSGAAIRRLHSAKAQQGNIEEADRLLARWLEQHPTDSESRRYMAESYLKAGRYAEAVQHYRRLLNERPDDVAALNNVGWALRKLNDPRAVEFAEKAYALRPQSAAFAGTLGSLLLENGRSERALELLEKAVLLDPDSRPIRYHFALGLVKTGDWKGARRELERVLAGNARFENEAEARALLTKLRTTGSDVDAPYRPTANK